MSERILLSHGGGGTLTAQLLADEILPRFGHPALRALEDAAVLEPGAGRIAFTTDTYVVQPVFFPGGNIGDLAVCGTVNDLAMMGAAPRFLSLALVLEEGFLRADLARVLDSVRARAEEAQVQVVTGDTKVVPRGQADGLYVNTAGLGTIADPGGPSVAAARPGDRVLISGAVGLHGLAVLLARGDLSLETPLKSDVASLAAPVRALLDAGVRVRALRDLTRGGLAMALHDVAEASGVTVEIDEAALPEDATQAAACELLGIDPLTVACEGRFLAVVDARDAERAAQILTAHPVTRAAAVAGTIRERGRVPVELVTAIGTRRVLAAPRGEEMPRIC